MKNKNVSFVWIFIISTISIVVGFLWYKGYEGPVVGMIIFGILAVNTKVDELMED